MSGRTSLLALALVLAVVPRAHGATLLVENYGLDDPTCGSKATPCRSLSQAIANATDGDKIVVGPGRYGDLDGDGAFATPGEEDAEFDIGCDCMIEVDKRLTLTSTAGAGATILDAGGASLAVVRVTVDGVVFGKKKKGFTLRGSGNDNGLETFGTSNLTVAGNRARNNSQDGFQLNGIGHKATNNRASHNGDVGLELNGDGFLVKDNAAIRGSYGFYLEDEDGTQAGTVFVGNVATENDDGIFVDDNTAGVVMKANLSHANEVGLGIGGSDHVIEKSSFIGNAFAGVRTQPSAGAMAFSKVNVFGNNDLGVNCGFEQQAATAPTVSKSYWGAASGPGANPADAICGGGPAPVQVKNASKQIKVKAKVAQ